MTKVSVFGEQPTEPKKLKKIEFVKWLKGYGGVFKVQQEGCFTGPKNWAEVCLLAKNYQGSEYDLIFARSSIDSPFRTCLYLGHWNDGVV